MVGMRVRRIMAPSRPSSPTVAEAATTLWTQIILPAAPPTACRATIRVGDRPVRSATSNWKSEKVMLLIALLTGDEGKPLAGFQQELLQLVHECSFQILFQQATRIGQAEKLQHDRIANEIAGRRCWRRQYLRGRFFVLAGPQPFVRETSDLSLQDASTPVLRGGFLQIPLTCGCRIDAKE